MIDNTDAIKASGIIRRIDDLGRMVIPKEMRRSQRWRESDPIEIIPLKSGDVLLRKYSHMEGIELLTSYAAKCLSSMLNDISVLVCDRTKAISGVGKDFSKLVGHQVCDWWMDKIIESTDPQLIQPPIPLFDEHIEQRKTYRSQVLSPIILDGSPIGAVILVSEKRDMQQRDLIAAETAARLITANLEL